MVKNVYDYLLRLSELDNIVCCCAWPVTVLWKFSSFPRLRQSVVTRLRLVFMVFLTTICCLVLMSSVSWKIINNNICSKIGYRFCEMLHGPAPVYRIYFGLFIYLLTLGVAMLDITESKNCRALLHNRFWTLKTILLVLVITGFLLVPRSAYTGEIWHFFGLNAAFAYIVLQFLFLLDITHGINGKIVRWIESTNERSAKYCFFVLWLPTSMLYILSIYVTATFYRLYSLRNECSANAFFISFHIYMCASATFISIHPIIQAAKPKSGLLQSSVVTGYSSYIMWLTLSNEPDEVCNPTRVFLYPIDPLENPQILFSTFLTFFILFVFSTRIVDYPQYGKQPQHDLEEEEVPLTGTDKELEDDRFNSVVKDDELNGVEYSYSFFLITLSMACLYLMMTVTNWYRPEEEENLTVKLMAGWGAVWIKLCGGMFCVFIYIWSLVAPVIFPHSYKGLCFYEMIFSDAS